MTPDAARAVIDAALTDRPGDADHVIRELEDAGFEIKPLDPPNPPNRS